MGFETRTGSVGKGPVITPIHDRRAGEKGATADRPCLFLLFDEGLRPNADLARSALASGLVGQVSHDPRGGELPHRTSNWIELLLDGLTFDVLGLAPGKPLAPIAARHHFGLSADTLAACEAVGIAPGPHLRGAANALPVIRTLLRLGVALAGQWPHTRAALWAPAASAMERRVFIKSVDTWLGGGPFPALGLTGVVEAPGGTLASDGLTFFIGQELVLDRGLSEDRVAGTRLLLRLIDALAGHTGLAQPVRIALDSERSVLLRPAGGVIHVSCG